MPDKYPSEAEIAEMKARGFDPATIAQAQKQTERWPRAQELCALIQDTFAGVKLGKGVGLMQAQGLDDYADSATCASYRAGDEKDDWRRIPTEALNRCSSSLSFFDAEGMRFHLPAYLIADLRGEYHMGMAFTLTHLEDHSMKKFSLLTRAQRAAVRSFLEFIESDPDYQFDQPHIVRALSGFWAEQT